MQQIAQQPLDRRLTAAVPWYIPHGLVQYEHAVALVGYLQTVHCVHLHPGASCRTLCHDSHVADTAGSALSR